jgi:hypothetical protein
MTIFLDCPSWKQDTRCKKDIHFEITVKLSIVNKHYVVVCTILKKNELKKRWKRNLNLLESCIRFRFSFFIRWLPVRPT